MSSRAGWTRSLTLAVGLAAAAVGGASPGSEAGSAQHRLTLLVTSGLGGQLVDPEGRTVAAVAATVRAEADRARAEGWTVVVLDLGRTLTPYAESRYDGGATMIAALEGAGYDAYVPDPMDFSLGGDQIRALAADAGLAFVLPQMVAPEELGPGLGQSAQIELGGGLSLRVSSLFAAAFRGDLRAAGVATGDSEVPERLGSEDAIDVVVVHSSGAGLDTITRRLTWSLVDEPRGADLLLDPDMGHDMSVRSETREGPVFLTGRAREKGPWTVARLDARLERTDLGWDLRDLETRVVAVDGTAEVDSELDARAREAWSRFHRDHDLPLLAGGPTTYLELRRFALRAMRETTRAEVAVLNRGGLRPVAEKFFAGDVLTNEAVLRMLAIDQQIEVTYLTGSELKSLATAGARRVRLDGTPRADSLEFLGLSCEVSGAGTPNATATRVEVNGRPIEPEDLYRVVTNRYLLAGGDDYPLLTGRTGELGDDTYVELRSDVVVPRLAAVDPFVDLSRRSLWRYGFDQIALLADGVQTDRDPAYEQSSDSRARAADSTSVVGKVEFRIHLDRTRWRWENRLKSSFGLLEVDHQTREVDDDLRLDSSVVFPKARVLGGNPFAGVHLDSEIRRNSRAAGGRAERQFEQTLATGITWETRLWPRIRIGAVGRNYSNVDRDTQLGLSGEAELYWPARGRRPGLDATFLAEHLEVDDSQVDRLDVELALLLPLVKNLMFTPTVNYYLFDDSDFPGAANYYRLSLGLSYRWSGKHQSWGGRAHR